MPSEPHQKHLLIIEDDTGCRELILDKSTYSVGRDPKCDIRLVSQFVSRRHATLVQMPVEDNSYTYRIIDGYPKGKPSSNGLIINGHKLRAHNLEDLDEIVFGPKVRATYRLMQQTSMPEMSRDQFDVTWINPDMLGD